jgi:hypothetical protein
LINSKKEKNVIFLLEKWLTFSKIHDDLLLFICQNISSRSDKSLEKTLLIKNEDRACNCICFCMPPVDSKEIDFI